jgi:hypothetical protein
MISKASVGESLTGIEGILAGVSEPFIDFHHAQENEIM